MFQDRKEYRKSYNSSGELYVAGELLDFISYDISVKGILVEIIPGLLLIGIHDFETLLKEDNVAEIYVKDLMLTGKAEISWVRQEKDKILLGLEFKDVMSNAAKLWRKRRYYRSKRKLHGYLIAGDQRINFESNNISSEGLEIKLDQINSVLKPGGLVKLEVDDVNIKGVGKIIWVNVTDDETCVLGLRYLAKE